MMNSDRIDETELEELFEEARGKPPSVPDGLMVRVIADAAAMQPVRPWWARLVEGLGGMPALGGLVTATCVGVWLGVSPPENLPDLAGEVLGYEMALEEEWDAVGLTGFGWDIEEG